MPHAFVYEGNYAVASVAVVTNFLSVLLHLTRLISINYEILSCSERWQSRSLQTIGVDLILNDDRRVSELWSLTAIAAAKFIETPSMSFSDNLHTLSADSAVLSTE